jgi:hypothetical protein
MNQNFLLKEVLLPDCAHRDMQGTKGDCLYELIETELYKHK